MTFSHNTKRSGEKNTPDLVFFISLVFSLMAIGQVVFGLTTVLAGGTELLDFRVYYGATLDFLTGANPYLKLYAGSIPFNYPPSALIFFLPATLLPIKLAQVIWLILQAVCLIVGTHLLIRKFLPGLVWVEMFLVALLLQNFPTKFTLVMGQVNPLVLLLIILGLISWWRGKVTLSGLALGAAGALKITPLFLLLFFLKIRSPRVIRAALAVFVLANAVFLAIRPELFREYFQIVLPSFDNLQSQGHYYDQSFLATLARFGTVGPIAKTLNLVFIGILGIWGLLGIKHKEGKLSHLADLSGYAYLLVLVTVFNAFAWQHHLVFLFPAYLWGAFVFWRSRSIVFGLLLELSAVLVGFIFASRSRYGLITRLSPPTAFGEP